MRTALKIGISLLSKIKLLHGLGYVHGDLKPNTIIFESESRLHFLDLGLSRRYLGSQNQHIPDEDPGYFEGTIIFASQNTVRGCVCTRRDDIESLFYVILLLLKRHLPWPSPKDLASERKLSS